MGKRRMLVTIEFLVSILKGPGEVPRIFTVENSLPADTRVVGGSIFSQMEMVELALESQEWEGESELVMAPKVHVRYGQAEVPFCDPLLN